MGKTIFTFARKEVKYILTKSQFDELLPVLLEHMTMDEYGLHTISNIYYDTDDYALIRRSLEKPVYKEKFRVRGYGEITEDSAIFAEVKKKYQGIVYKRRVNSTYNELLSFVDSRGEKDIKANKQIKGEISWVLDYYKPKPKVMIAYERIALFGNEDNELRVTFDQNIRYRENDLELKYGHEGKLITDKIVMEVKIQDACPLWLTKIFSDRKIYSGSFSKYGTYYANEVLPKQFPKAD